MIYPIVETFYSIQGEGFHTGTPSFFIRLAGCDIGCYWCDTKESWSPNKKGFSPSEIKTLFDQYCAKRIVITGGEPLIHSLDDLTSVFGDNTISLETSGAYKLSGSFDWITLSPKRHKPPLQDIYRQASELKIVIDTEEDLLFAEEQASKVGRIPLYLQPQWSNSDSKNLVFEYVLRNPHWQISLQTHKMIGVK